MLALASLCYLSVLNQQTLLSPSIYITLLLSDSSLQYCSMQCSLFPLLHRELKLILKKLLMLMTRVVNVGE